MDVISRLAAAGFREIDRLRVPDEGLSMRHGHQAG
jgi:hypothetical protein